MKGLGLVFETIMGQLPAEAKTELLSELNVLEKTEAAPAGAILIGMYILEYVGFPRYVDTILGEKHTTIEQLKELWKNRDKSEEPPMPSPGIILSLMVADMIACPRNITPTYKFEENAEEWRTGPLLGIEPCILNDDRIGRAMSAIGAEPQNLQEILFKMMVDTAKKAGIPLNKFIMDTTVLELDGKFKDAPKVVPGRGMNSLSQLIVSLVIASGSRIPVAFDVLAGSTSDSSTLPHIYERVDKVADDGPVEFLMDRIYPTPSNILFLEERKDERMVYWVSPLKTGLSVKRVREEIDVAYRKRKWKPMKYRSTKEVKAKIEPPLSAFETTWTLTEKIKPDLKPGQTRRPRGSIETKEIEVRCVFYRHEQNANREKELREFKINQLEKALQDFSSKLNKRKYRELKYCHKKLLDMLKPFAGVKKFLQYDLSQAENGTIFLTWSWDKAGLEEETKYDGIFALLTNYAKIQVSPNQLVTKYRSRDQVEVNFKDMRGILDLERVLYSREERIDTFIFLKVIALFILAFLRFYAEQEGVKTTEKKLQESMGDVLLVETTITPLGMKLYGVAGETELEQLFRKIFSLPDPHELIEVLNEAEKAKVTEYVREWYEAWLKESET